MSNLADWTFLDAAYHHATVQIEVDQHLACALAPDDVL
jgi:hypothetical protein